MSSHGNNKFFAATVGSALPFGVVAIGRNEGERLRVCLDSLTAACVIIYVDSGSTDDSVQMARSRGIDVVELDRRVPFSASRARNAGFARLCEVHRDLPFVQFIDGDCELDARWPRAAIQLLQRQSDVAAVCGRLRDYGETHVVHVGGESAKTDAPITSAGRQIARLQVESELLYFRKHYALLGLLASIMLTACGTLLATIKDTFKPARPGHRDVEREKLKMIVSLLLPTRWATQSTR